MSTIRNPLLQIEETTQELNDYMHRQSRSVFDQYPFIFSMLGTFGVVSILYGFDAILDEFPLMKEHPVIPLAVGILILIGTGNLYKRLERKIG